VSSVRGKRFLTPEEAAEVTGQGVQEILHQINAGKLKAVFEHATNTYRINEIDVEAFKKDKPL
jgi:excisionase family DNA binding protein